jgi:hypothetical protein
MQKADTLPFRPRTDFIMGCLTDSLPRRLANLMWLPATRHWPILAGISIYLAILAICLVTSLRQNQGTFVYALDDPYVHMAVAKNLATKGIWGANANECLWILIDALEDLRLGEPPRPLAVILAVKDQITPLSHWREVLGYEASERTVLFKVRIGSSPELVQRSLRQYVPRELVTDVLFADSSIFEEE